MAVLALPACERVTDLRPEGNGTVVVECVLTQEDRQTMRLSLTDQASAEDFERLKQARVQVFNETEGTLAGTFTYAGRDTWEADLAGLPEHTYRLEITVEGYNVVSARTTMPERPAIKSLKEAFTPSESTTPLQEIGTRFLVSSLPEGPVWIINGDARPQGTDLYLGETEEIATSLLTVDPFNWTGTVYDNWASERFAQGIHPFRAYTGELGPVKCPPCSFYYNVEGQPVHDRFIRIPSVREAGPRQSKEANGFFTVTGQFLSEVFQSSFWFGKVLFAALSEEYDHYLKDLLIKLKEQESPDDSFLPLYGHNNTYSNIENGVGVFGSITQVVATLSYDPSEETPLHEL